MVGNGNIRIDISDLNGGKISSTPLSQRNSVNHCREDTVEDLSSQCWNHVTEAIHIMLTRKWEPRTSF